MLRRGYNYMEGTDSLGRLEGGLMFIAYVRNPQTNFIPISEEDVWGRHDRIPAAYSHQYVGNAARCGAGRRLRGAKTL